LSRADDREDGSFAIAYTLDGDRVNSIEIEASPSAWPDRDLTCREAGTWDGAAAQFGRAVRFYIHA
jgi:hypothetical protein